MLTFFLLLMVECILAHFKCNLYNEMYRFIVSLAFWQLEQLSSGPSGPIAKEVPV